MRLAVTTTIRGAPLESPAGYLRVVDLTSGEQEAMSPLPDAIHRAADPNPRGGTRGGRGLAATRDRLAVAVSDRIFVLDRTWTATRVLTHRWMGGIHDLAADHDGLWVTCADNDLVLRVGWDGRLAGHWHWRRDRTVRRALGHGWLPGFDRRADHRDPTIPDRLDLAHVNAVTADGDELIVGLGWVRPPVSLAWPVFRDRCLRLARRIGVGAPADGLVGWWRGLPRNARRAPAAAVEPGRVLGAEDMQLRPGHQWALVRLSEPRRRPRATVVACHPGRGVPAHNAVPYRDRIAVADSGARRVVSVDRRTGVIAGAVEVEGDLPFPRGLMWLGDDRFVVGTQQPATLTVVDLAAGRVEQRLLLPDDQDETPYAIAPVPEGFDDARARLPGTRAGWRVSHAAAVATPCAHA